VSWRGLLAMGLGLALATVACTAIPIHIPQPTGMPDAGYAADGGISGHFDGLEGRDALYYPDAGPAPVPDLSHYADMVFPGGDGLPQGDGGPTEGGPTEGGPTEGGPTEGGPTEGGTIEGGTTEAAPPLDAGAPALDL
jgi:hypothetical protein